MEADALLLARIQFAFTIAFHILFPAFTIGLASWLAMLEARWLLTGREVYRTLYRFWVKIFAVSFAMGVVSGIVMSYQFGTNWSRFSEATAPILGPLLGYEVLTAFFLEASFLGIMLFGWDKVGRGLHFVATLAVAGGTLLSAFWILAANSWMHTPDGFEVQDGVFHPVDWWAVVFNPSFPYRLAHMTMAAYLTTAFVVAGVAGWYLCRGRFVPEAKVMMAMAAWFTAAVVPLQILAGDLHGLNVGEHQPAKLAAMEAHWDTGGNVPFVLFAWPDQAAEENRWEVAIPELGSLILTHEWGGVVQGLTDFAPQDRPPVAIVFFAFRVMLAVGFLMLGFAGAAVWLRWRGRLHDTPWFQRFAVLMLPSGFVAVLAGWITAEVGRQPFVVHGLMRTADASSPVAGGAVATSLAAFMVAYAVVFGAGLIYLLRLVRAGPGAPGPSAGLAKSPARPLSAPDEAFGPAE